MVVNINIQISEKITQKELESIGIQPLYIKTLYQKAFEEILSAAASAGATYNINVQVMDNTAQVAPEEKAVESLLEDKYNWSFDGEAEVWYNCGASIQDCIDQARDENATDHDGEYKTVFIGERVPFNIAGELSVEAMLESLEESAYDFCGDAADSWDPYDHKKPEEINELRQAVASVVIGWLEKYGRLPRFCAIENVAEYDL